MMMAKKVSMKDIAKEIGVSVALVSYVLNGKLTNRINLETAEKIRNLAKQYNYTPNQIAKSLKSNKTYTIGLVVADIANQFYAEIAQHIEREAEGMGYNVVFASAYEDAKRFASIIEVMISKQVDGLILAVPEGGESYVSQVEHSGIPFVLIDREIEGISPTRILNIDNYLASEQVVKHLHEAGFNKPAAIALKTELLHLNARKRGFLESVRYYFKEEAILYEIAEKDLEQEIEAIILQSIYKDRVDVFYFFTNRIAMAALAILAKHNIAVPEKIGVICFDEAEAYKIFKTSLSYVKQPLAEMSKAAVYQIIHPNEPISARKYLTELVIQQSTILSKKRFF